MRKQEFAELKTAKSRLRAWKGFSGSYADVVYNDKAVGIAEGGEAVGDGDGRAPLN